MPDDPLHFDDEERTLPAGPSRRTDPGSIGRYRLLHTIGSGAMGTVYLAEQREPVHRRVAVKVIKSGLGNQEIVARFEAERQALARMSHPGIARVLDAGVSSDGRPYFVMEYVPGETLVEYCDRKRLSNPERLDLFRDVCRAVHHAHQKGVIHRDLKPGNILVCEVDGKPQPKVIDFGLAKAIAGELTIQTLCTEYGKLVGTPAYMSPEQAEPGGFQVDVTSDVYSLGAVLYELLTGELPFDRRTLNAAGFAGIQQLLRDVDPPRPSDRVTTLEGPRAAELADLRRTELAAWPKQLKNDLDWIVMQALDKERSRRYSSSAEFASDIERYLANDVVAARPPTFAYRARKFYRRNRPLVLASSLVLLSILAALVVSMVMLQRAVVAERQTAWENYVSNIRLAATSVLLDERRAVRSALSECAEDDRGWEWHHLRALTEAYDSVITTTAGYAQEIQATHDGRGLYYLDDRGIHHVDAATNESTVVIEEPDGGIRRFTIGPGDSLLAAVVPGSAQGHVYARRDTSGRVFALRDVFDLMPPRNELAEFADAHLIRFARDGGVLVTAGQEVVVRSAPTWVPSCVTDLTASLPPQVKYDTVIEDLEFAAGSRLVVAGTTHWGSRLIDGHSCRAGAIAGLGESPDIVLVVPTRDEMLYVVERGGEHDVLMHTPGRDGARVLFEDIGDGPAAAAWIDEARALAVGYASGVIRVWAIGQPTSPVRLLGHDTDIVAMANSAGSSTLYTSDLAGRICSWSTAQFAPTKGLFRWPARMSVVTVELGDDGRSLWVVEPTGVTAFAVSDPSPTRIEAPDEVFLIDQEYDAGGTRYVIGATALQRTPYSAIGNARTDAPSVRVFQQSGGASPWDEVGALPIAGVATGARLCAEAGLCVVSHVPEPTFLANESPAADRWGNQEAGSTQGITAWRPETGEVLWHHPEAVPEPGCLDVSADGRHVIAALRDGTILVVDARSGRIESRWRSPGGIPTFVRAVKAGEAIVIGDRVGNLHLWEIATNKVRHMKRRVGDARDAVLIGDPARVVTIGNDDKLTIWHPEHGDPLLSIDLPGAIDAVRVEFDARRNGLVVVGEAGFVVLPVAGGGAG